MKILVADKISTKGVEFLRNQPGFEVVEAYGSPKEKLLELVKDVHAIAVRSDTKITAEIIAAAPQLRVVGRAGVGVDNVDVEAATERGVVVMNTPSGNTIATAELTFTHMLCGARPVPQAAASMREGKWDKKSYSGIELYKKVLGVVGLGRIGSEVARRAQAFGMRVLAYDPFLAPSRAKAMQVEQVELDQLLRESDYITVHMPLTDQTHYMIDEAALAKTKKGVRVFNCARGGIIKESALIAAIKEGQVAAAGLDVYETEPLPADYDPKDDRIERGTANGQYTRWTKELGVKLHLPVLDLTDLCADKYEQMGREKVNAFYSDHNHTYLPGADIVAASVVSGLKAFKDSPFIPLLSEKGKTVATADAKYVSDNPAP